VTANEVERQRWNDDVWTAVWPKRERFTDAVTASVLQAAALQPGERVLDVGSGGGKTSQAAGRLVGPEGAVVGADISVALCELATGRASDAGAANVTFRVVDMQTGALEGEAFDVAMSQFGVMFFDEPATAFANIRAHLKLGGRLVFACWQAIERNPWFFAPALAGLLPTPPPPAAGKSPTGPFQLADRERTSEMLRAAGFADVRSTEHNVDVDVPEDSVVDKAQLAFMGVPPERLEEAMAAVSDYMSQFVVSPTVSRFPLAFQVFEATNP
jgi:SAM-dependent methyltransferase